MIVFSIFGILLYDVGFLVLITWAVYRYIANITKPGGVQFVRFYRFLFNRFSSKHYYYALIYCVRNLLLALLPITLVNQMVFQVLLVSVVISSTALLQTWLQP